VGRGEPVEHILLHGPPGLGKTTLAHVIANEVGARVHVTNGPALTKGADLNGILNRLEKGDVLFIDEIHRLPVVVEECLYSAMEDFKIDFTVDSGMHARTITIPVKPFTLIGATTRLGLLTGPMRGRFGIAEHIEFYSPESLHQILKANAISLKLQSEDAALTELAKRSRGTPRRRARVGACDSAAAPEPGRHSADRQNPKCRQVAGRQGSDDFGPRSGHRGGDPQGPASGRKKASDREAGIA